MSSSPILFSRGTSFAHAFNLPEDVPDGFFKEWSLKCQLRRAKHDGPKSLIAEVGCFWLDPATNKAIGLSVPSTDHWPLGLAELDVTLTSPSGQVERSNTIVFDITRGITKNV